MFKRMRNKKGFTLIEIMIVMAIIGILAAIAIPAYIDRVVKSRLSEVTIAMDTLALSASEYHASHGEFPGNGYTIASLAAVATKYASWLYVQTDVNVCTVTATLSSLATPVNNCTLVMTVSYVDVSGYDKSYSGTLGNRYMPKK